MKENSFRRNCFSPLFLYFQQHTAKGRHIHLDHERLIVARDSNGVTFLSRCIQRPAIAVPFRVEDLCIHAFLQYAEYLMRIMVRREVEDDDIVVLLSLTDEGKQILVRIVRIDPLKALPAVIICIQRRFARIQFAQLCEILMERIMCRVAQQELVIFLRLIPFPPVGKLISHKVELLSRMREHI